jgi:hypothetical protein
LLKIIGCLENTGKNVAINFAFKLQYSNFIFGYLGLREVETLGA